MCRQKRVIRVDFPSNVVWDAWTRSNHVCECNRRTHNHVGFVGRCTQSLTWLKRANRDAPDGWETHHKVSVNSGGDDTLSNCEILCSLCHKKTETFGG